VKEKVLAAHRAGLKTVIIPRRNEKDLADVPEEVRQSITFVFVDHIEDVLQAALEAPRRRNGRARRKVVAPVARKRRQA